MSINFRKQSQEQSTSNRHWPQIVYIFPAFNILYRVVAKIKLFSLKFCAPRSKKGKNSKSETSLEVKKIDANSKFMFRLWCAEEIGTFFATATASFWKRILASAKSQNVCAKNHIWHLENFVQTGFFVGNFAISNCCCT